MTDFYDVVAGDSLVPQGTAGRGSSGSKAMPLSHIVALIVGPVLLVICVVVVACCCVWKRHMRPASSFDEVDPMLPRNTPLGSSSIQQLLEYSFSGSGAGCGKMYC